MRGFGRALVVLVVCFALTAEPSLAKLRKVKTHIDESSLQATTTGNQITRIVGAITVEKPKCLPNRTVDIASSPNQTLQQPFGSAATDAQGHFDVSGSAPANYYFAIYVQKLRLGQTVCKSTAWFGQFPQ